MRALSRSQVDELIGFAAKGELDNVVGSMVRMSPEALAELRAVMWLGKDGETPKHWDALVIEARSQVDSETPRFMANTPDLADYLGKGLDKLEAAGRI